MTHVTASLLASSPSPVRALTAAPCVNTPALLSQVRHVSLLLPVDRVTTPGWSSYNLQ